MRSSRRSELDDVWAQFEAWRAGPRSRAIPDHLWRAALRLLERYRSSTICRRLGLNASSFKRMRETLGWSSAGQGGSSRGEKRSGTHPTRRSGPRRRSTSGGRAEPAGSMRRAFVEIRQAQDDRRALRHAYSDLVSTFEVYCKRRAERLGGGARFQDLFDARKFFKDKLNTDFLDHLTANDLLLLRRVFQKRHAVEHSGGLVDEKYIRMIPEDVAAAGTPVELTLEELEKAAGLLRGVIIRVIPAG